jgi:hypothetical protein
MKENGGKRARMKRGERTAGDGRREIIKMRKVITKGNKRTSRRRRERNKEASLQKRGDAQIVLNLHF